MKDNQKFAVIGAGNIGLAIAQGIRNAKLAPVGDITLTRRKVNLLESSREEGFVTTSDNLEAVKNSRILILAVEPRQADDVLTGIAPAIKPQHLIISVVSGLSIHQIRKLIGQDIDIVRAMPNTAIAIRESMTCLATETQNGESVRLSQDIFNALGTTKIIREELMAPATALAACGLAFFLRAIRAASQGGIEIGFHSADAIEIAAQTARGAATLLLANKRHPEFEIDKVTTPRGVTISGLNQMEHDGFSSAMIRGIVASAEKAAKLYVDKD